MRTAQVGLALTLGLGLPAACAPPPKPPAPQPRHPSAHDIFEEVAPSIVAVLNDDAADRERAIKEVEKSLGDESHAPKHVIDVSDPKNAHLPDGTGFVITGGRVATAAHVVRRPDRLKIRTRAGQTVEAELEAIDHIRDVAVLKPKQPLAGVVSLAIDAHGPIVGEQVWALGHTGQGTWSLAWGMSSGIASGQVDVLGAKLVLFDAPVYPGFSGGPVVRLDAMGNPQVLGINHAILFTGAVGQFSAPIGSISSAVLASEIDEVTAHHVHPLQKILADYANAHRSNVYADLFITDKVSVSRDASDQPVASIVGDVKSAEASPDNTLIPVVAMMFGLPLGEQQVDFDVLDPDSKSVAHDVRYAKIHDKQRVSFVGSYLRFPAKIHGKYSVVAKHGDKEIGRAMIALSLPNDDNELVDEGDTDPSEDGNPDVDVVVAEAGNADPLVLAGIRAGWAERSYPRQVGFSWFARATRGWAGTNVMVSAFVLDEQGNVAGRANGCFFPQLRPEHTWSCYGTGQEPALLAKEGRYDIVFAVNDRPVAWWPMEATIRSDASPGSDIERWMRELERVKAKKNKKAPGK